VSNHDRNTRKGCDLDAERLAKYETNGNQKTTLTYRQLSLSPNLPKILNTSSHERIQIMEESKQVMTMQWMAIPQISTCIAC
jgi:hypothetical protein